MKPERKNLLVELRGAEKARDRAEYDHSTTYARFRTEPANTQKLVEHQHAASALHAAGLEVRRLYTELEQMVSKEES